MPNKKKNKAHYLRILLEEATPAETCHVLINLGLRRLIRKYKLQRLLDGAITGVVSFLALDLLEPANNLPIIATAVLFGCYVIISGGFFLQPNVRNRSNSAD